MCKEAIQEAIEWLGWREVEMRWPPWNREEGGGGVDVYQGVQENPGTDQTIPYHTIPGVQENLATGQAPQPPGKCSNKKDQIVVSSNIVTAAPFEFLNLVKS